MPDWIDITRTLTDGMIHWPGDTPFHWERTEDITGPGTANMSRISTGVHAGTHLDAPLHFIAGGKDVVELPLAKLCGPAVVVQVTARRDVAVEDLQAADIRPGERVLLRTVNEALWDKPEFDPDFFAISGEAAMWLVDREVPLVGIDSLSVDSFHEAAKPAHYALLANEVIVVEGLDLSQAEPGRYELVCLPLKIAGSEGSPVRAIIRPVRGR